MGCQRWHLTSKMAGFITWLHRSLMAPKQLASSGPALSSPTPRKARISAVLIAAPVRVRRHAGGSPITSHHQPTVKCLAACLILQAAQQASGAPAAHGV